MFQCSETCGTGTQTRKVYCSLGIDRENACDQSTKPEINRACLSDKDCNGLWFTGPWSQVRYNYNNFQLFVKYKKTHFS